MKEYIKEIDESQEVGEGEKRIINYEYIRLKEKMEQHLGEGLPTLSEMVHYFGPYLGLVLSLVIVILILQYIWFRRILKAKNEEIKRLADREQKLNDRYLFMISEEIGYKKREKN